MKFQKLIEFTKYNITIFFDFKSNSIQSLNLRMSALITETTK